MKVLEIIFWTLCGIGMLAMFAGFVGVLGSAGLALWGLNVFTPMIPKFAGTFVLGLLATMTFGSLAEGAEAAQ